MGSATQNEAVIVSTARTAVGHRVQGVARRRRRARAGHAIGRRGRAPVGHRSRSSSTTSSWASRSTAAATSPATPRSRPGSINVPGLAHNRHCASGLAAVQSAAASICAGMDRVVVAGGAQSSSTAPAGRAAASRAPTSEEDWLSPSHRETPDAPIRDMSITVGWNAADEGRRHPGGDGRLGVPLAPAGHRRDRRRQLRRGDLPARGDRPRRHRRSPSTSTSTRGGSSTLEKLASLKPLHPEIEGFSITAGNAAGVNDGAAAMVVADRDFAEAHGLEPLAVVRSWASVGVPPADTGLAPTVAIPKALARAGLSIGDVVPLGDQRGLRLDVRGATTRPRHRRGDRQRPRQRLQPRPPGRDDRRPHGHDRSPTSCAAAAAASAVAAMCAGGGMATAVVLEVPAPPSGVHAHPDVSGIGWVWDQEGPRGTSRNGDVAVARSARGACRAPAR